MAKRCINAFRTYHDQELVLKNMKNGSARTNFTLTTQRRFEHDAQFIAIRQEAQDEINRYQAAIKGIIIKKIEFEIIQLREELAEALVQATYRLVKMIFVSQGETKEDSTIKILTKTTITSTRVTNVLSMDMTKALQTLAVDPTTTLAAEDAAKCEDLTTHIVGLLINPLRVYHRKEEENKLLSTIRSIATFDTVEDITAATAMAVDQEPTAAPKTIQDEIQRHVQKASKGINDKMDTLLLALKNKKKGQSPSASENKKKTGTKNKQATTSKKKPPLQPPLLQTLRQKSSRR
jgi:hypothetical protein